MRLTDKMEYGTMGDGSKKKIAGILGFLGMTVFMTACGKETSTCSLCGDEAVCKTFVITTEEFTDTVQYCSDCESSMRELIEQSGGIMEQQ